MVKGIVAIVGRPNVGKSTLFNRLTKKNLAIVDDRPGVTRDRLYGTVWTTPTEGFTIIDTGGFETKDMYFQPFAENVVWQQTEAAIEQADVILLMFDNRDGLHQYDTQLVRHVQKLGKPVIFASNKCDGKEQEIHTHEFFEAGIDEVLPVSAEHGRGMETLLAKIQSALESTRRSVIKTADPRDVMKLAIVGRPNVGKSSILNRLCDEERSLVSDIAGTTRDTVDVTVTFNGKPYQLVDTAGVRRRSRVSDKLDTISMIRSLKAMEVADAVVLVVDASEGLTDQDARLASMAAVQMKPILLVVNKWDLVEEKDANTAKRFADYIRLTLPTLSYVPILFTSAVTNQRVHKILEKVALLWEQYERRVPTRELNDLLERMVHEHTPALIRNHSKRVKFYYATQVKSTPPTIIVFCNVAKEIQESYKRYMMKRFRSELGFEEVPLRVVYRGKEEARAEAAEEAQH